MRSNESSFEYGVMISYQDGHVEYERYDSRAGAESRVRIYNQGCGSGTATLVGRLIGAWDQIAVGTNS